MKKVFQVFAVKQIRDKILFILGVLVLYRLAANVPLPGIDVAQVKEFFSGNQLFGLLNIFSGGGLSNISIVLLGVGPYITSSIVMQLLTMIVPQLDQMNKEEGEVGRQKFTMITRVLTVPFALLQTFATITLLRSQGVMGDIGTFDVVSLMCIATAGTIFLMWLGELITEKGLGNGVSLIIFAGIVASLPSLTEVFFTTFDPTQIFTYIAFVVITLITIAGVVLINEGQRKIPISYAKRMRGSHAYGGQSTHLPLRVNQAGVIPIIFAISIILFPTMIAGFLAQIGGENWAQIATTINNIMQNQWIYGGAYFLLVVLFTYFYTAIIFDPNKISENLQKQGGFIPGIRPGNQTSEYLGQISRRITLTGSLFLGLIAILPILVQAFLGESSLLSVGGTSILIVVSVVVELVKQIEGQLVMRSYDSY